ncbi:hypothetical protein ACHAW6_001340 [Cyclotella cf. meneghiniana]
MIIIAFFFLLRPREYTDSDQESTSFRFSDVQLFIGQQQVDLLHDSIALILQARFTSLTFTDQKIGLRVGTHTCVQSKQSFGVSFTSDLTLLHLMSHRQGSSIQTPISLQVLSLALSGMRLHCWVKNLVSCLCSLPSCIGSNALLLS